ncbi:MAG: RHS repeat-associated core domain-containing protein [Clostridia bacterium]|nr:RHS repeat-associated core domain-containing protein [Clostridia bacterium]
MSFDYNSSGLRTKKTVNGEEKQYFYSGDLLISEYNGLEYMNFTYSPSGEPVGFSFYDAEENEPLDYYFYFKNIQGDIIGLLDHQGAIYCTYSYDAWGKLLGAYDRNGNEITNPNHAAIRNPLRYRGYYYDTETGLYYLNSRYYNPEWGTFISADTIDVVSSCSANPHYNKSLYAYCDNNPIARIDASGYFWATALDIVSLVASATDVVINPGDPWAWVSLIGDAVDIIPFITGIGEATKSVKLVIKATDDAPDVISSARRLKNSSSLTNRIRSSTGSYEILYESGKNYVGKGGFSRAITSAIQHAKPNQLNNYIGDTIKSIEWRSATNPAQAYVEEYLGQQLRGVNNPSTYNLIWSPGRNIFNGW